MSLNSILFDGWGRSLGKQLLFAQAKLLQPCSRIAALDSNQWTPPGDLWAQGPPPSVVPACRLHSGCFKTSRLCVGADSRFVPPDGRLGLCSRPGGWSGPAGFHKGMSALPAGGKKARGSALKCPPGVTVPWEPSSASGSAETTVFMKRARRKYRNYPSSRGLKRESGTKLRPGTASWRPSQSCLYAS